MAHYHVVLRDTHLRVDRDDYADSLYDARCIAASDRAAYADRYTWRRQAAGGWYTLPRTREGALRLSLTIRACDDPSHALDWVLYALRAHDERPEVTAAMRAAAEDAAPHGYDAMWRAGRAARIACEDAREAQWRAARAATAALDS